MDPLAQQLNKIIEKGNPYLLEMLSDIGKKLYFPKGIIIQSTDAKKKAYRLNATIGIATEKGETMCFPSVMCAMEGIKPEEALTYASSFGLPALREIWLQSMLKKNPSLSDKFISLPLVTCGITHAVDMFGDLWVDSGDVIVLPEMMWPNYKLILSVRKGARISCYPMFTKNAGFNLTAFEQKVKEEAKKNGKIIVLLNFPNNPSGYTVSDEEGNCIVEILIEIARQGINVIALVDDAYFGLFYDEVCLKESLFARLCNQHPRLLAVKLDGATKENFVWGLRVGFITYGCYTEGDSELIYDALEKKTAGCIRGSISNASHLGQSIVLKSMQDEKYPFEKQEKFEILKTRAMRLKEVLLDSKYKEAWDAYPFNSGYFMSIRLKGVDAEALRLHVLEKYGVGIISMGDKDLRIAFSCLDENDIQELFDTIFQGVKDLKALS